MPTKLSIVTPERPIVETDVDYVVVPGSEGEFGILPQHELFLAPLRPGVVEYAASGERERVAISGGFAEVTQDHATLLARTAEPKAKIDRARAERARSAAADALQRAGVSAPPEQVAELRLELERAEARLQALASG